jgi:hypothetical protein
MKPTTFVSLVAAALFGLQCGSGPSPGALGADAGADAGVDGGLQNQCVDTFGTELTNGFGRLDGVLYAVVRPQDQQCAKPNAHHLILEVRVHGAYYRLLINVESTRAGVDPNVRFAAKDAPLPGDAWSEGWHTSGPILDYVQTLSVHNDAFQPYAKDDLVNKILSELRFNEPISVFATGFSPEGADLIHRNLPGADGAVVIGPTSGNPRFLLFHFDGQVF